MGAFGVPLWPRTTRRAVPMPCPCCPSAVPKPVSSGPHFGPPRQNRLPAFKTCFVVPAHESDKERSIQASAVRALCHIVFPSNALSSNAGDGCHRYHHRRRCDRRCRQSSRWLRAVWLCGKLFSQAIRSRISLVTIPGADVCPASSSCAEALRPSPNQTGGELVEAGR